jgi:hypothetical protein
MTSNEQQSVKPKVPNMSPTVTSSLARSSMNLGKSSSNLIEKIKNTFKHKTHDSED